MRPLNFAGKYWIGLLAAAVLSLACGSEQSHSPDQTGSIDFVVSGLPPGVNSETTVTGPHSFSMTVMSLQSLTGLMPGTYNISAALVTVRGQGSATYAPAVDTPTVSIAAGETATVNIIYSVSP